MKILHIDDSDVRRSTKRRLLQRAGHTVLEAASGAEALRLTTAEQPDLVLLAVPLPDMSGSEFCRRIKRDPATAAMLVVQMSAMARDHSERAPAQQEGADAYLHESIPPEEFMATLKTLLRLRQTETILHQMQETFAARMQGRTAALDHANDILQQALTTRLRLEATPRARQQFLHATLDALAFPIAVLDHTGVILRLNAAWQQLAPRGGFVAPGYGRGRDIREFFTTATATNAKSAQDVVTGIREVSSQQRAAFSCAYAVQDDPEPQWFCVHVTRFDEPEGLRVVVLLEDTTEVKRTEEALRRQQADLYQREKLTAMGALLASVAHELNNPLAVVQMQVDLLVEDIQERFLLERVTEIQQATERCRRMVQNFLTLAHYSPPQRTLVQLNVAVTEILQMLQPALHLDAIVVHHYLDDALPLIGADVTQLQQTILHLLRNAHQALRETSAPRQVTLTTQYDLVQARVILEVADTGPGIPSEMQGRIFEPFFTTKPIGAGPGLGLSICRGIVEGHGGTINVTSQPGHGASFRVELPVAGVPVPDTPAPEALSSPVKTVGTLLIVDDEIGLARGLARLLRRDGYYVDTEGNGRQALALLETQEYHLLLCDLRMPELDGPGLYQAVASRWPHLLSRFIFLTGDALSPDTRNFLEQTGLPRLIKPFTAAEGRRVVRQALLAQR